MSSPGKRPLSQLIYARVQEGSGSPRLLTLHRHNQHARDVQDYALAANPDAKVIGLESYKGVFVGKDIVGYTWFIGPFDRPSPLYFGDAIAEIERFLWDEIDRQGPGAAELPFLLGVEQGAIMALAAAAAVPDLISGVIAVEGSFPIVPGWEPPLAPLDGLPILVIEPPDAPAPRDGLLTGQALVDTFSRWGGAATRAEAPAGEIPASTMATWLAAQPVRRHNPSSEAE